MSILTFGETAFGETPFGEDFEDNIAVWDDRQSVAMSMSLNNIPTLTQDFAITIDSGIPQMSFDKADSFVNNVYLSLMVRRGDFFQNPEFGSRLHELFRRGNTEKTALTAVEYCKEALQWTIDIGRAVKYDIYTQIEKLRDLHRLKLLIVATQKNGRVVTFTIFVGVV